jgi:hypothetical protein
MKPILLFALLTILLAGCSASLAEVRQSPPTHTIDVAMPAVDLSYCVLRAIEGIDSVYTSRLSGSPDQREFFITVARQGGFVANAPMIGFELHFLSHDHVTTVDMREGHYDGRQLARQSWPLIERCSQQARLATAPSAASASAR